MDSNLRRIKFERLRKLILRRRFVSRKVQTLSQLRKLRNLVKNLFSDTERKPSPVDVVGIPPWWESKEGEFRNWLHLPPSVMLHIFMKLGTCDIVRNIPLVCSTWKGLSSNPCLFTRIIVPNPSHYFPLGVGFFNFIKTILENFGTQIVEFYVFRQVCYDLLHHVSQRGQYLKHLKLDGLSYMYLHLFAKGFPQLEHLHLYDARPNRILENTIREVGRSCPNLKSLHLHFTRCDYIEELEDPQFCEDRVAFAIATYMPQLLSIDIFKNTLGNRGVFAILEGCPKLQHIGLRRCPFIDIHDSDWDGLFPWYCFTNRFFKATVINGSKGDYECNILT